MAEVGGMVADGAQRYMLSLVEPFQGVLVGGAMDAQIGHALHPCREVLAEVGVVLKGETLGHCLSHSPNRSRPSPWSTHGTAGKPRAAPPVAAEGIEYLSEGNPLRRPSRCHERPENLTFPKGELIEKELHLGHWRIL